MRKFRVPISTAAICRRYYTFFIPGNPGTVFFYKGYLHSFVDAFVCRQVRDYDLIGLYG
jgi:hypothetical protein